MEKKLTDKKKRVKEVNKIVLKIRKLEKTHEQGVIKSACTKYVLNINARLNAESDIEDAKKRLAEAEGRLD